jgi:hypothetical protein
VRLIKIIISLELVEGSPDANCTYRVFLFKCKNGAVPVFGDVFGDDANGYKTPLSLRNIDNIKDFDVLLDDMFRVTDVASTGGANVVKNYNVNTCIAQKYNSTTAASIVDNPLMLYIISSGAFGTTGASGQINIRTLYTDA